MTANDIVKEKIVFVSRGCAMQDNRHFQRFECNKPCHLHWHGSDYPATIKNMSTVAMGLHFDCSLPDVHRGDDCEIYLYDDNLTYLYEMSYQIVRTNTSDIVVGSYGMVTH